MNLFIFYIFGTLLIGSSLFVVALKNPVYSVLCLILAFFCTAALFLLQGAEFLAMLMVIIYVGAVAILFLFVVMMLNIDFKKNSKTSLKATVLGIVVSAILFVEISMAITSIADFPLVATRYPVLESKENIKQIGEIIYTDLFFHFQVAGLILLVAMIGAVMLTLRVRENVRKQKISEQVSRKRKDSVKLVNVLTGKGV
jgi:NADH-quinone oxidoreductase subunit J